MTLNNAALSHLLTKNVTLIYGRFLPSQMAFATKPALTSNSIHIFLQTTLSFIVAQVTTVTTQKQIALKNTNLFS